MEEYRSTPDRREELVVHITRLEDGQKALGDAISGAVRDIKDVKDVATDGLQLLDTRVRMLEDVRVRALEDWRLSQSVLARERKEQDVEHTRMRFSVWQKALGVAAIVLPSTASILAVLFAAHAF